MEDASGTRLTRRHLMCCSLGLAVGLFSGLTAAPAAAQLANPCRGRLPDALREHALVRAAFEGLDPLRITDTHAHLLGTGDSGSGCSVHPSMYQWWRPLEVMRRRAILNAACVEEGQGSVDEAYVRGLAELAADFPAGARWWLFAFDLAHDDRGRPAPELSTFHVPDSYCARVAAARPERFAWVASIHPYREDAVPRLQHALGHGAVAVKWLPSTMNIDLRDTRCKPFYAELQRSGTPLIVHCGEEKAAPGAGRDELNNPLFLRHPLQVGVKVIAAHCASLGQALDLDSRKPGAVPAFGLWARLMDEANHGGRLLGDLSAVFQRNRRPRVWRTLLSRSDWHARLLHGSDHPLPGVLPLVATSALVRAELLDAADVPVLKTIREHNPLMFDFVLKRRLRDATYGTRLPASVFEARALHS